MFKRLHFFVFLTSFLFVINTFSFSADSSFYCVPLNNYSKDIYSDKVSKYLMLIKGDVFVLPETSTQKILRKNKTDGGISLLIQTGGDISSDSSGPLDNYLTDSRLLNLDDPEIVRLGQKFRNSKHIISDVEGFVYSFISDKTIGIPIISASDILKNKAGDCTEHTVLTVSILRSAGIPARALAGMVFAEEFEGSRNTFVYHMWAEAFISGKWMLVDSTVRGKKHENRYIAFAYHHLQTEMPLLYLTAVSAMKTFSVEYVK